ncbi:MAG: InlB B-repeat-containing protein [Clostridia bacterium]|nr:InlB B-repeat-containing protein [Clostridia bacterium]
MKFRKAFIAIILALSMITMSACDIFGGVDGTSHSVKLVLKGGTVEEELTSYKEGSEVILPIPTRDNFDFVGWYADSDYEGEIITKISSTDTGNKTFYAKWTAKTFSVTFELNGGMLLGELDSYTYLKGAELPSAEKTGYVFVGWYENEGFNGEAVRVIGDSDSGDKTFYAKWNANKYGLTLNTNGGTLKTNVTEYSYGTYYELPEPERTGYRFLGWYTQNEGGNRVTAISATDSGAKTFYARWQSKTGNVTLHANGGALSEEVNEYQEGVAKELPIPEKNYYDFAGWYDNENFTGRAYSQIPSTAEGDVEYWAKWTPKTYSITLNANGGTVSGNVNSYVYGTGVILPTNVTRNGYTFIGWYTANSGGTKVTAVTNTDNGDKTYYARWGANLSDDLKISACAGYDEGIYVEFPKVKNVSENSYSVHYKKHSESDSKYVEIDDELVRVNDETATVRADIVGIAAGIYDVQVVAGDKVTVKENITVTAQDRSGYAHFNATSGVGGYNNDGTPKSNAQIIYVTEATKNSVTAQLGSTTCKGIVKILQNLSKSSKPVIIRIVGTIGAATWNTIEYNTSGHIGDDITPDVVIENTLGHGGATLSKQNYTQKQLSDGGFNTYNTSVATVLDNLEGTLKWDDSKKEFDSCWNDCQISGAENVTVEGIGTDAGLFQWGLTWKKSNSIEIKNLTFSDYTEDACSFEGSTSVTSLEKFTSTRIWLHNNTFNIGMNYWDVCNEQDKHDGDGSTDFKGTAYVTIAYNHYIETHKTGLIGGGDSHKSANITFHHNFYDKCQSRLPLARQANMHMYNNYYYKSTGTNMSIRAGGYAFIEACYFENALNPVVTQDYKDNNTTYRGVAKLYNCAIIETGVDDKYKLNTTAYNVTVATSRTQTVSNDNIFNKTFDTDSSAFYYKDSKTQASRLTSAEQARLDCLNMAGVLKPSNYVSVN